MARKITLRSPMTPVAIASKLRDTLGDEDDAPRAGVTGHGTEAEMTLFVYRPNFRNSFATGLTATIAADGTGTRIDGRIGPPSSSNIFMIMWFGILSVSIMIGGGAIIASGQSLLAGFAFLAIPLGMMVFGWGLQRLGTWNDRKDQAAILKFLADTVQAREI